MFSLPLLLSVFSRPYLFVGRLGSEANLAFRFPIDGPRPGGALPLVVVLGVFDAEPVAAGAALKGLFCCKISRVTPFSAPLFPTSLVLPVNTRLFMNVLVVLSAEPFATVLALEGLFSCEAFPLLTFYHLNCRQFVKNPFVLTVIYCTFT